MNTGLTARIIFMAIGEPRYPPVVLHHLINYSGQKFRATFLTSVFLLMPCIILPCEARSSKYISSSSLPPPYSMHPPSLIWPVTTASIPSSLLSLLPLTVYSSQHSQTDPLKTDMIMLIPSGTGSNSFSLHSKLNLVKNG